MTTATDSGVFIGKTYTLAAGDSAYEPGHTASREVKLGDKVVMTEDDGTHLPYFNVVDDAGGVLHSRMLINVRKCKFIEVGVKPAVPHEITVRVSDVGTTFTVTRVLTKQEIAAVFVLLNN